jgi:hypothetical protein
MADLLHPGDIEQPTIEYDEGWAHAHARSLFPLVGQIDVGSM